jgi:hypothetical protein
MHSNCRVDLLNVGVQGNIVVPPGESVVDGFRDHHEDGKPRRRQTAKTANRAAVPMHQHSPTGRIKVCSLEDIVHMSMNKIGLGTN